MDYFLVGLAGVLFGAILNAAWPWGKEPPKCPYCNRWLSPLVVRDTHDPPPAEADWYCSASPTTHSHLNRPKVCYFANKTTRSKPAGIEEI